MEIKVLALIPKLSDIKKRWKKVGGMTKLAGKHLGMKWLYPFGCMFMLNGLIIVSINVVLFNSYIV